jgi:sulfite reductase (NADPH) hemoprotein beta-component
MTEKIKINSNYLRGDLAKDLQNQITGSVNHNNHQLIKFHGIYEQDDRDRRKAREEKKLERDYSFMIRLRIAGGRISNKQWLAASKLSEDYSNSHIKITTRQTIQLHGIIKSKLKPTIQYFDKYNLDSIAACGDVNRNVIASIFGQDIDEINDLAVKISDEFLPKSNAYKEIWLDGEKVENDHEPLYGQTYLPRKFKIAIANPPFNDVDVYAHDIGLVKIADGYNIIVGGGMGTTHGNDQTYPRLGSLIAFSKKEQILEIIKQIILIQRDFGNRENRKQARLKYTIDHRGLDWFKEELTKRLGFKLDNAKDFEFSARSDQFGFLEDGRFGLFIENGRVFGNIKETLDEIAKKEIGNFNFSNNQNILITDIKDKNALIEILVKYNLDNQKSEIRKSAMACVALNTCPLALAEAQRYLPDLLTKIEDLLTKYQLQDENISIRMTGCPNGCARPYLAEIGLVGTSLGRYNLHLGGGSFGQRLNRIYKNSLNEEEILKELDYFFGEFVKCDKELSFGNFANKLIN